MGLLGGANPYLDQLQQCQALNQFSNAALQSQSAYEAQMRYAMEAACAAARQQHDDTVLLLLDRK